MLLPPSVVVSVMYFLSEIWVPASEQKRLTMAIITVVNRISAVLEIKIFSSGFIIPTAMKKPAVVHSDLVVSYAIRFPKFCYLLVEVVPNFFFVIWVSSEERSLYSCLRYGLIIDLLLSLSSLFACPSNAKLSPSFLAIGCMCSSLISESFAAFRSKLHCTNVFLVAITLS